MYTTILLAAALQNWERCSPFSLAARNIAMTLAKGAAQQLHVLSVWDYPPLERRICSQKPVRYREDRLRRTDTLWSTSLELGAPPGRRVAVRSVVWAIRGKSSRWRPAWPDLVILVIIVNRVPARTLCSAGLPSRSARRPVSRAARVAPAGGRRASAVRLTSSGASARQQDDRRRQGPTRANPWPHYALTIAGRAGLRTRLRRLLLPPRRPGGVPTTIAWVRRHHHASRSSRQRREAGDGRTLG